MAECFFHTGRPSVTRCKQCGRPLCGECRIIRGAGIFCSEECADRFSVFSQRAEEIEEKRNKSGGKAGLIRFIIFVVVLLVIFMTVKKLFW